MEGPRDPITTNLWCVPITTDNNNNKTITTIRNDANLAMMMIKQELGLKGICFQPTANSVYQQQLTAELQEYLIGCLGVRQCQH